MARRLEITTLEQLVALASNPHEDTRYDLSDWHHDRWDEEEAGKAWQAELDRLEDEAHKATPQRNFWDDPKIVAFRRTRPAEHRETSFSLSDRARWSASSSIGLTPELGEAIAAIWPTKEKFGSPRRTGTMTLKQIVKRLGVKDIDARVKARKIIEGEQAAKNHRRYARREVKRLLTELKNVVDNAQRDGVELPPSSALEPLYLETLIGQLTDEAPAPAVEDK